MDDSRVRLSNPLFMRNGVSMRHPNHLLPHMHTLTGTFGSVVVARVSAACLLLMAVTLGSEACCILSWCQCAYGAGLSFLSLCQALGSSSSTVGTLVSLVPVWLPPRYNMVHLWPSTLAPNFIQCQTFLYTHTHTLHGHTHTTSLYFVNQKIDSVVYCIKRHLCRVKHPILSLLPDMKSF